MSNYLLHSEQSLSVNTKSLTKTLLMHSEQGPPMLTVFDIMLKDILFSVFVSGYNVQNGFSLC